MESQPAQDRRICPRQQQIRRGVARVQRAKTGHTLAKKSAIAGWLTPYPISARSGLHDAATGRTILDQTFSTLVFRCAILGGGHSAASAFLGHVGIFFYWIC
jgi:hypothetical protein